MEDIELGSVLLNVDETTVMDGILAEGDIEVGQYVFVEYDGRLTRSLPPQAHADRVGCYRLTGTVDLSLSMGCAAHRRPDLRRCDHPRGRGPCRICIRACPSPSTITA